MVNMKKNKLTNIIPAICFMFQFSVQSSFAKQQDPQSSGHSIELPASEQNHDLEKYQKVFLATLNEFLETGKSKSLVTIINEFTSTRRLDDASLITAFQMLAPTHNQEAKVAIAEHFSKDMIGKLSKEEQSQICEMLLIQHSKKFNIDLKILKKAHEERETYFKVILHCLRNTSLECAATPGI